MYTVIYFWGRIGNSDTRHNSVFRMEGTPYKRTHFDYKETNDFCFIFMYTNTFVLVTECFILYLLYIFHTLNISYGNVNL